MEKKEFPLENVGLEKIQHLLEDEDVLVIMVNGPQKIFVEKKSGTFLTDVEFVNDKEIFEIASGLASHCGFRLGEKNPVWDIRLSDGSRVTAIVPPVALQGTVLTIYKNPNSSAALTKD